MKQDSVKYLFNISLAVLGIFQFLYIQLSYADAQLNPNQTVGTVSFTNENEQILEILEAEGIGFAAMRADSIGLSPVLNNSMYMNLSNVTEFDYQMTVESSDEGIQYAVKADLRLDDRNERYILTAQTSEAVFPEPASDSTANIQHCAAMVDVRFVDGEGEAVAVDGGTMNAWRREGNRTRLQAQDWNLRQGTTQDYLAILGDDSEYNLQVIYDFGTNFYEDKVRNMCQFEFTASCDQMIQVDCFVSGEQVEFGSIIGNISIGDETLLDHHYLSRMEARHGPFNNLRYDDVSGEDSFNLQNLVPSNMVDPELGYMVYGHLAFGTGYDYQFMRTPIVNERVIVNPGQATDLGNRFVMQPGYWQGDIEVVGPTTETSALQYLRRDLDTGYDYNNDGLPNGIYFNHSHISVIGSHNIAEGAQHSASGAMVRKSFEGALDLENGKFTGNYHMALAGLNGEAAIWKFDHLALSFNNIVGWNGEDPYYNAHLWVKDRQLGQRELAPGETQEIDQNYCINDVSLAYTALAGEFYNPRLRANGNFQGEDYNGDVVDYTVYVRYAQGLPRTQQTAAESGSVALALPQGTYNITPEVTAINPGGGQTNTELPAVVLNVGCGQVIRASTEIQVSVGDVPKDTLEDTIVIEGTINSNGQVHSIDYSKNENDPVVVCNTGNCAPEGKFSVEVPLDSGDNSITVTAHAEDESTASVSVNVEYVSEEVEPELTLSQCSDINSVTDLHAFVSVSFNPIATGGCTTPTVTCDADSGDVFRLGNTKVSCSAEDTCGNVAQCEFFVNVEHSEMREEHERFILPELEPIEFDIRDTELFESIHEDVDAYDLNPEEITDEECQTDDEKPVLSSSMTSNTLLWSPNHKLEAIGYVTTINHCDDNIENTLTTVVYSDEPEEDQTGDGTASPDAAMSEDGEGLMLRSERDANEDGRVYLIISQVTDDDGLVYTDCSAVGVPHNQSRRSLEDVTAQMNAAVEYCKVNGTAPDNFYLQAEGENLGPKQTFVEGAEKDISVDLQTLIEQSTILGITIPNVEDINEDTLEEIVDVVEEQQQAQDENFLDQEELEAEQQESRDACADCLGALADNAPSGGSSGGGSISFGTLLMMLMLCLTRKGLFYGNRKESDAK